MEDLERGLELVLGQPITSASVPSPRTTAFFSSARSRALRSSRSRAACSNSKFAAATCICFSSRRMVGRGLPGREVAELRQCGGVVSGHPANAGRRALADVAEQARPGDLRARLNTPFEQVRAGNTAQEIKSFPIAHACA
jgi:hypothetical protein